MRFFTGKSSDLEALDALEHQSSLNRGEDRHDEAQRNETHVFWEKLTAAAAENRAGLEKSSSRIRSSVLAQVESLPKGVRAATDAPRRKDPLGRQRFMVGSALRWGMAAMVLAGISVSLLLANNSRQGRVTQDTESGTFQESTRASFEAQQTAHTPIETLLEQKFGEEATALPEGDYHHSVRLDSPARLRAQTGTVRLGAVS